MIRETVTMHTDDGEEYDVIIVDRDGFSSIDTSEWEEGLTDLAEEDFEDYGVAFIDTGNMSLLDRYFYNEQFYDLIDYVFEHYPYLKEKFETERAIRESEDVHGLRKLCFSTDEDEDEIMRSNDSWEYEGTVTAHDCCMLNREFNLYSKTVDGKLKYQIRDNKGKVYVVMRNPNYNSSETDCRYKEYYRYMFSDDWYFNAD